MNLIDKALINVSYGLYTIGANDNERPVGCIVNTVSQVTAENPIISVSMNKKSYTAEIIQKTKRFSVSILSEQADPSLFGKLGFFSGRSKNKWDDVKHTMQGGLPLAQNACAHLVCELIAVHPAETHFVILARVKSALNGEDNVPMTYRYYHEVVKGKAPENAPTFHQNSIQTQKEEKSMAENVSYVCTVCGYVYEGDITKEPDDYVCPLCGVGKDMFELQEN